MRYHILLLILLCPGLSLAQNFKTYYESGAIQSETPLNDQGEFEGLGKEFYEDGTLAAEVPYHAGKVHGVVNQYYPEGHLKLRHSFVHGQKQGNMYLYSPDGTLRMLALMEADSILFSQRFDTRGRLVAERTGMIKQTIDTAGLGEPVVWLAEGSSLKAGVANPAMVFIKGFPGNLISYASPSGTIEASGREDFPLLLTPIDDSGEFILYLRLRLNSLAQPSVLKMLKLEVE